MIIIMIIIILSRVLKTTFMESLTYLNHIYQGILRIKRMIFLQLIRYELLVVLYSAVASGLESTHTIGLSGGGYLYDSVLLFHYSPYVIFPFGF